MIWWIRVEAEQNIITGACRHWLVTSEDSEFGARDKGIRTIKRITVSNNERKHKKYSKESIETIGEAVSIQGVGSVIVDHRDGATLLAMTPHCALTGGTG